MKIALAQINPKVGDLKGNTAKIIENITKAKEKHVDLVVFSELVIPGYPPRDLLDFDIFVEDNLKCVEEIKSHTKGIGVVLGLLDFNANEKGKKLRNSAVFINDGEVVAKYNKALLPFYDVFDETRYFEPGDETCIVDFKGLKIGLSICEDLWNDKSSFSRQQYVFNPIEELVNKNAGQKPDFLVNLSASPYHLGKEQDRFEIITKLSKNYELPIVYVNQVGGNDDLLFDGMSFALDKNGQIQAQCKDFEEDFIIYNFDENIGEIHTFSDCKEESVLKALKMGLNDYCSKMGFKKIILGLSGGIDSALTAVIAAYALGAENVLGITMPSMYSSAGSVSDSEKLAKTLGIGFKEIPIKSMFDSFVEGIPEDVVNGLAEENLQARIRSNILMSYSNNQGYMLLSTGNKSEMAVGYCTLYGDMSGGLNLLCDLPKTLVYAVSRYINKHEEVIPWAIIEKPPSAELRPDQKDEDSLPPYDVLDDILENYIEKYQSPESMYDKYGKDVVDDVINKTNRAEYKRNQATLGLKVTTKAFGSGRRFPIVQGYKFRM